jgi:hypothetical protein
MKIPFDVAVKTLQDADAVLVRDEDGNEAVATFVGFGEEGEDDSPFTIGSDELWDIDIENGEGVELTEDRTGFLIEDTIVTPVYKKEIQ